MATYYNVPGVYILEKDLTSYTQGVPTVGAAIITPTAKGPAYRPTYVSSYAEYDTLFGSAVKSGSDYYEYLGSVLARDYFASGGETLLVVPIKSGSYTPASGSTIQTSGSTLVSGSYTGLGCFSFECFSDGAVMNSAGGEISGSANVLVSGSKDNLRWEIAKVDNNLGTFSLYIRQGNDTSKRKIILEEWNNLTLDPQSTDYISARIGDMDAVPDANGQLIWTGSFPNQSKYIRITSVTAKTPDSRDVNDQFKSTTYSGSLPVLTSGSFAGGSDGTLNQPQKFFDAISSVNSQGYDPATTAYDSAIALLSDPNGFQFNLLMLPGLTASTHPLIITKALAMVEARKDCVLLIDPVVYGSQVSDAVTAMSGYDSNYAAAYHPFVRLRSSVLNRDILVPPTTVVAGVYAYTDKVARSWFAPAGENRAKLDRVKAAEKTFDRTQLGQLLDGRVNPLKTNFDTGVVVWGQKTLQQRPSALDRIGVRRLMIEGERFVHALARGYVFDPNTPTQWLTFTRKINAYFGKMKEDQGISEFKFIMDETNNTPEIIDRGLLVGTLKIIPTHTAEAIEITFELHDTGEIL